MVTSSRRAYAIPRCTVLRAPAPAAVLCWPVSPQEILKHSSSQCLGFFGSWCTQCLFGHSEHLWQVWGLILNWFSPPAVFLGLFLCPWTWGLSSKLLQHHAAATKMNTLLLVLLCPWRWDNSSKLLQHHAGAGEDSKHGHHQLVNTKSDWLCSLQAKMEKLYTVSKNKTGRWLWLRSWTPYCEIQT